MATLTAAFGSSSEEGAVSRHLTLAGVEIDPALLNKFVESFRRFNIKVQTLQLRSRELGDHEKVHGCVLPLKNRAVELLKNETWFAPRRTVIYGVGSTDEAGRFLDLGINALVQSRSATDVQGAVDATQSLISRGIGKCARVPIAIPVRVDVLARSIPGVTRNIGCGGMAIELLRKTTLPLRVTLSVVLPGVGSLILAASPRWYSGNLVGLQFQPPVRGTVLKRWVRQYSLLGA